MLDAHPMVNPVVAPFENCPNGFDAVSRRIPVHVLTGTVLYAMVVVIVEILIASVFVSVNSAAGLYVLPD